MAEPDPSVADGWYDELRPAWALTDALLLGSRGLRTSLYSPKHEAETEEAYQSRMARTFLLNIFRFALRTVRGKMFARPIDLAETTPSQLRTIAEDVDLEGRSLDRWARQFFYRSLQYGAGYILVDHTRVPSGTSAAAERRIGPRPYFVHVTAPSLLAADAQRVGGQVVVTYARIRETAVSREGFGQRVRNRVRELKPGEFILWEQDDKGAWAVIDGGPMMVGGRGLEGVPLVPYYTGELDADFCAQPPLQDLAEKNLEHWQSSSDQRNITTFARYPMLAVSGADPNIPDPITGAPRPFVVGPRKILHTAEPQGKWYYVEPQGTAIEAGRKDLADLKDEMATLALEPFTARPNQETATGRLIDTTESRSPIMDWAYNLKDALDYAFWWAAQWMQVSGDAGGVVINAEFSLTGADAAVLTELGKMRDRKDLSRQTYWEELRRREVLSQEFDADAEEGRLEAEGDYDLDRAVAEQTALAPPEPQEPPAPEEDEDEEGDE